MTQLVRYDEARRAVQACVRVDEVKDIADKARALQAYAKQAKDPYLESWVAEIRIRARQRLGEISKGLEKAPGARTDKPLTSAGKKLKAAVLKEAGISTSDANRCEKLAAVPVELFEKALSACREKLIAVTADEVLRSVKKQGKQNVPKARAFQNMGRCCQVSDLERFAETGPKCGTIYADPAWQYGNQATRASTGDHYIGMSVDAICELPVAQIAAESAHLHLWTTNAFLFDAKRVIDAWGFEYRSCYVWIKPQMGMGNYWRVSHEFLLLGIRGSAPFEDKGLMSWGQFPRRKHSSKPEEIRGLIEKASEGPRIELFARRQTPGWYVWGNEIERAIFDAAMEAA